MNDEVIDPGNVSPILQVDGRMEEDNTAQFTFTCTGRIKKMRHFVFLISLDTNMLENWDIIHWKGGIHSFVWSTKTFLYDIWEPRYKQIKMGYQISKCLNIGQS